MQMDNLANGTQAAINAIRAIPQLYDADIAAICAALSCKVSEDRNAHLDMHKAAVDSLDDLTNFINDAMGVEA